MGPARLDAAIGRHGMAVCSCHTSSIFLDICASGPYAVRDLFLTGTALYRVGVRERDDIPEMVSGLRLAMGADVATRGDMDRTSVTEGIIRPLEIALMTWPRGHVMVCRFV